MCRYGTSYKPHYACFECRKTFKRRLLTDIDGDCIYHNLLENKPHKCPECSGMTADMGLDFKSPKKNDVRAWSHIKNLYGSGITFHSCGCSGPGYIPKDTERLVKFLKERKQSYIKQMRFWTTRTEPKSTSRDQKDWQFTGHYFYNLPKELKLVTRNTRKTELKKAVSYWVEKINVIETRILEINLNN